MENIRNIAIMRDENNHPICIYRFECDCGYTAIQRGEFKDRGILNVECPECHTPYLRQYQTSVDFTGKTAKA